MKKIINKILRSFLIFTAILGISFSNGPFYVIDSVINSYLASRDIVDKAFHISKDENVVDKFNSYRNLAEGIKVQEARAAAGYIGNSNIIYTNGGAPGAITPNASTSDGDLLVFYHYSRATGGNETVNLPAGFTPVFSSVTVSRGLVAVGWRMKQAGDGTFQASITNHTAGNSGETVIEFIQTYRGTDTINPIVNYTASLSNWASSLNIGPIAAPAIATVNDGDMAVVFGGRFENITGQTVLSGNSLTWAVRTTANTNLGTDAGAVVQTGLNSSGASQTITAKTITTTGTTQAGAGRMFIIKKQPNTAPVLSVIQPDGTSDTVAVGDPYNIMYDLSDAEDAATVNFYYDSDTNSGNGYTAIPTCQNQAEGSGAICSWDTTGITPGNYYIYGIATDGVNPDVSDYSPGMITINAAVMDATSVSYEIGGDGARSGYSAIITGSNFGTVLAGSRANCAGGAGTGCVRFIVGGNATVTDADVTAWSNSSITFAVNANLASYGGLVSLQVVSAGAPDSTPLDFYIYPNISSAPANGQIGSNIVISGDHFGTSTGSVTVINNSAALIGGWSETSLTVRIPGQQGVGVTTGKIQLTRSDAKTSNQYPAGNFTIDPPLITSSSSSPVTSGQTGVVIHFNGFGIDSDTMPTDTRPVFRLKKTGQTSIQGDNVGAAYGVTTAYQNVYATFDLSSAIDGAWDLELTNMDGFVSTCGGCLTVNPNGPSITGISPANGFDFELLSGISINGNNFDLSPTIKLTMAGETDLTPSTPFTRVSAALLNGGAFDFTEIKVGTWTVVVTNPSSGLSGSYSSLTINSAISNIFQFAANTDLAQPPTLDIAEGGGLGNQSSAYFRLDMDSNKTSGETITPEFEMQPIGISFQCILPNCPERTSGFFVQGSFPYSGIMIRDFLNVSGITAANDGNYHWHIRLTNSAGKIGPWTEFGTAPQATNTDLYLDNTPPLLAGVCPASNISDTSAMIDWNTNDANPPGEEDFATAQVEYKIGTDAETWSIPGNFSPAIPNPRAGGIHMISLSNLSPGSGYVLRARSKDFFGNEGFSANCTFATGAAMPIKTVEMFIAQEQGSVVETARSFNFSVTIPENPNNTVSLRSAMIELNGVSGASASDQTINVGFLRGNQPSGPAGDNFTIESSSSGPTPFTILFDALNVQGNGQENMQDLTTSGPAGSKNYTLFLKGTTTPTYVLNAKLILTYSYTP
ncbi:MAG: IPT/TIG domain-containing protein [Candidatus Paceibacterota bacterium]|jgi:hypothetical protein